MITDPIEISNLFNHNVVSMGPKIDAKITSGKYTISQQYKNQYNYFLDQLNQKKFIILFLKVGNW